MTGVHKTEEPELMMNLMTKNLKRKPEKVHPIKVMKPKEVKVAMAKMDKFVEYSFIQKVGDQPPKTREEKDLALLIQLDNRSMKYKETIRIRFRRSSYLSCLYTIDGATSFCREGKSYDAMEIVQIDTEADKKAEAVNNTIAWLIVALAVSVAANGILIAILLTMSLLK